MAMKGSSPVQHSDILARAKSITAQGVTVHIWVTKRGGFAARLEDGQPYLEGATIEQIERRIRRHFQQQAAREPIVASLVFRGPFHSDDHDRLFVANVKLVGFNKQTGVTKYLNEQGEVCTFEERQGDDGTLARRLDAIEAEEIVKLWDAWQAAESAYHTRLREIRVHAETLFAARGEK